MKKYNYKLKKDIMLDSVCGMGLLACKWRTVVLPALPLLLMRTTDTAKNDIIMPGTGPYSK